MYLKWEPCGSIKLSNVSSADNKSNKCASELTINISISMIKSVY